MKKPILLAIESSCDDTAIAIVKGNSILSNIIGVQHIHNFYGGVNPEIASRYHQRDIVLLVHQAIFEANIVKKQIDAVAFTKGPGLIGSLLIGASFAKSLAIAWMIPIIGVHHIQAHILSHFIEIEGRSSPKFPFLCLTISGGHTQIILVENFFKMTILGQTIDDAVGEAFDKIAKIAGLPYPGGIWIDYYAKNGNPKKIFFSKPKIGGLDFSFSGLKTQFFSFIRKELKKDPKFIIHNLYDICASIQKSLIDLLFDKMLLAIRQTKIFSIALSGGVSSNSYVRTKFSKVASKKGLKLHLLPVEFATDNAAMIAVSAQIKYSSALFDNLDFVPGANCGWNL
ncbi:metalloendopeptidase glycoprotease family [Candidatus Uzinura diaspidicola str. ASNER]|uniref:tRNA N6-adenosine threonylcarbamoyltransferase n=1 Tax=Candidatus Uzinura diaspidicola str. ASNER TaxID=1133592 RepID=L7VJK7_9FLAO|nr:metalloendopeptidase glycoprotease family [Candidatus Uzinura diaspidicola str. ASNER]